METINGSSTRTWIVQLIAKGAMQFTEEKNLAIVAGPDTTMPVHGVRLRNHVCWATEDHGNSAPKFVGGFVAEAAGKFATKEEAVSVLAANPYFQLMALNANAGIEEPEGLFAYAPPRHPHDTGEFVVQRHSQARPLSRERSVHSPPNRGCAAVWLDSRQRLPKGGGQDCHYEA